MVKKYVGGLKEFGLNFETPMVFTDGISAIQYANHDM